MRGHEFAYQRFIEFLISRQAEAVGEIDIREYILGIRDFDVRIGYTEAALENSYPGNLKRLFRKLHGSDSRIKKEFNYALLPGTIYSDVERSHKAGSQLLSNLSGSEELILVEQGFLASTHSWAHAFEVDDQRAACLGYVYDDIAQYFMAEYPNRLIRRLNSDDGISASELERSRRLIERITSRKISKYNAQPIVSPNLDDGYRRRVLVCDQSFADASTIFGLLKEADFERMLLAAIVENPDAQILVKSHPDSSWRPGERKGYFSDLESSGRVRIIREPVNPYMLFEVVDTVYVGSSQMGMEALLAGKRVVCFGAPFYAGWGLTEDRCSVPHRRRRRTLEEIFSFFYVWYTIYNVPGFAVPSTIEDALHYIEANRPVSLPLILSERRNSPSVSVIIPVYGVEAYLEECLRSVLCQTLQDIEIIVVNDMSPDRSQEIIDRIASEDPRLRPVIMTENAGQGFARNAGIDLAQGDYIFFLDADDLLYDARVLEDCLSAAKSEDAEMVRVQKFSFEDGLAAKYATRDNVEVYFSERVTVENPIKNARVLRTWHFWNFLYSRDLLIRNSIRFRTPRWEERYFVCKAIDRTKRLHILPRPGVAYRRRIDSTTGRKRTRGDLVTFLEAIENVAADFTFGETSTLLAVQFANFFIGGGPWAKCLSEAIKGQDLDVLRRFCDVFSRFEYSTSSISAFAPQILSDPTRADPIALLLAACVVSRWDLAQKAIHLAPIEQDELYKVLLAHREPLRSSELEAALNSYARNSRVKRKRTPRLLGRRRLHGNAVRPRVVLHIGASKTGSTYLQHLMEFNRPALLRAGVWYPEIGLFWQKVRPQKTAGHALFTKAAVNNSPYQRRYLEAGLRAMHGEVHTIVLSSEAFFLQQNSHQIVRYLSDYQCEVVIYLRRQDEWANSQYCEFVGGGAMNRVSESIETWLETAETQRRMDYMTTLSRFETIVPRDRIRVRVFDRAFLRDGDVVADFAEASNLPILRELPRPEGQLANDVRLSAAHIQLLMNYNALHFDDQDNYFRFIEDVSNEINAWRKERGIAIPKPMLLTPAQRRTILDTVRASNSQIARDWLGREDGRLFDEVLPSTPTEDDVVHDGEAEIVQAAFLRWSSARSEMIGAHPLHRNNTAEAGRSSLSLSEKHRVVNYGFFGWRLWGLTPIVRALVERRGGEDDVKLFEQDPSGYMHSLQRADYQRLAKRLYPEGSVLGPGNIFGIWIPPLAWIALKVGGTKYEKGLRNNPVLFFRLLRNPILRFSGRIFFPIGEVVRGNYKG